eukprot:CAMPEP_0198207146 /NCGR_PEP_ID=MMETSP1445-20131203/10628_1 /TAXON_ID=36898 /ORGANISM="Pyramimonas sp., Strain CCMP2087" /LENGTH=166 /DNA_ID=CAMNT_0043880083 /DNA_START=167 /DNA_END=664 /DNA_ORIENTATION=-
MSTVRAIGFGSNDEKNVLPTQQLTFHDCQTPALHGLRLVGRFHLLGDGRIPLHSTCTGPPRRGQGLRGTHKMAGGGALDLASPLESHQESWRMERGLRLLVSRTFSERPAEAAHADGSGDGTQVDGVILSTVWAEWDVQPGQGVRSGGLGQTLHAWNGGLAVLTQP